MIVAAQQQHRRVFGGALDVKRALGVVRDHFVCLVESAMEKWSEIFRPLDIGLRHRLNYYKRIVIPFTVSGLA